jgi:hypothetical protein
LTRAHAALHERQLLACVFCGAWWLLFCLGAVSEHDCQHVPDQHTMSLFIAYLSTRLLDSSRETKAAGRIQRCWRRFRISQWLRRAMARAGRFMPAIRRLQVHVRRLVAAKKQAAAIALHASQQHAAIVIQCAVRVWLAGVTLTALRRAALVVGASSAQAAAVQRIQSVFRGHVARLQVSAQRRAGVMIQAGIRGALARRQLHRFHRAVTMLQV